MATYTYECSDCNNVFDIEATIQQKEEGKFSCPKCKSKNIEQKFSAVGFIKNIFQSDKKNSGCCSNTGCCGASCEPKEKDEDTHSNGGCCG